MNMVTDVLGRPVRDLRVSVTDRCNLRCPYCMPEETFGPGYAFLPRSESLRFEEIARLVRVMTSLGLRKVRLTGGEPLLRRELPALVKMLSHISELEDLALTTNGLLLADLAGDLRKAGLHRVTVSLDALNDTVFRVMSGSRRPVADVLAGVESALASGFPVKINCVLRRNVNEREILPLARYGRRIGATVRFIEYMDVGNHNGWRVSDVVPAREVREILSTEYVLEPLDPACVGETAQRYRYADGAGEVGFVASVTEPFCRGCNRARLTADGYLFTCLFAAVGTDLRGTLRSAAGDMELRTVLERLWRTREDRYSELRGEESAAAQKPKVEMSYVGG